jgi:hypothetical protein
VWNVLEDYGGITAKLEEGAGLNFDSYTTVHDDGAGIIFSTTLEKTHHLGNLLTLHEHYLENQHWAYDKLQGHVANIRALKFNIIYN